MVSKFRANVSRFNSWKVVLVLVSDWYKERLDSTVFAFDYGLGIDQGPIGEQSELSRPEFSGGDGGTVDDKLLCFLIISGGGLKTSDI
jgi:hypothetical protein